MVMIPIRKGTHVAIEKLRYGGKPRPYLGMSGSGEPCQRKRWYSFHWCITAKHDDKTERIFNLGHSFEEIIIQQLKDIGLEVFRRDKDGNKIELFGYKNEEQEEFIGFAQHAKGHPDGRVLGVIEAPKTEHLLELKTMAQKYFLPLFKHGLKKKSVGYYGQVQRYMDKANLKRTIFIAINKNTSDIYIERIDFDPSYAKDLARSERDVILAYSPPNKRWKKDSHHCHKEFCKFRNMCHGKENPDENCRTCEYSDLENDGKWSCNYPGKEKNLSVKKQRKGCKHWKKGWDL